MLTALRERASSDEGPYPIHTLSDPPPRLNTGLTFVYPDIFGENFPVVTSRKEKASETTSTDAFQSENLAAQADYLTHGYGPPTTFLMRPGTKRRHPHRFFNSLFSTNLYNEIGTISPARLLQTTKSTTTCRHRRLT